jgi:hypothetical protein
MGGEEMTTRAIKLSAGLLVLLLMLGVIFLWIGQRPFVLSLQQLPTPTPRPSWQQSKAGYYIPPDRPIAGEKVTLSTARSRLPFAIPLPTYLPGDPDAAYLAEVWASEAGAEIPSLALVYGVGVTIIVQREINPTNWHNLAKPPFVSISVNGYSGMGKDPGDQVLDEGIWHYPGSVAWQVGDLQVTIYGEYPMLELLKVAESMQLQQKQ